jgi:hypothetical protein
LKPFLRPPDGGQPVPEGWAVHAIEWDGHDCEVVYDPRRHDVALARDGEVGDIEDRLVAAGWEYQGTDGRVSLWVRDRVVAARAALDRAPEPPGREIGGLGR